MSDIFNDKITCVKCGLRFTPVKYKRIRQKLTIIESKLDELIEKYEQLYSANSVINHNIAGINKRTIKDLKQLKKLL